MPHVITYDDLIEAAHQAKLDEYDELVYNAAIEDGVTEVDAEALINA